MEGAQGTVLCALSRIQKNCKGAQRTVPCALQIGGVIMSDIIEVKAGVEAENEKVAAEVRKLLREHQVRLINLMASPGAGKTSLLEQTIDSLKSAYRIAVMEADVDADVDAKRIEAHGAKALQIHTGGLCHMDAAMTLTALKALDLDNLDLIFLENVGNLVCPAEFDTGSDLNVMILSVPEGDDKPLKYPLMFQVVDCVLVNKIDTDEIFDFDLQKLEKNIAPLNDKAKIIPISAFTGSGIENWLVYLREKMFVWSYSCH